MAELAQLKDIFTFCFPRQNLWLAHNAICVVATNISQGAEAVKLGHTRGSIAEDSPVLVESLEHGSEEGDQRVLKHALSLL